MDLSFRSDDGIPTSTVQSELHVGKLSFRELIADLDNAFVEWRYQHETGGAGMVKIHPTILAMAVLHEVSNEALRKGGHALTRNIICR
jgi:hypothetical protein